MKKDSNDRLHRSPIHLLHRAGQCAGDIFHTEMKDGDLTPRQLAVLVTVANNEGLSQTGLVDRTGIDRSTLADIVRRMQRKGLLQRRRTKEDARAYAVKLTDEEDLSRIRVGDYRVIYAIQDEILTILIVRVAHRKDVYRGK